MWSNSPVANIVANIRKEAEHRVVRRVVAFHTDKRKHHINTTKQKQQLDIISTRL